MTDFVNNPERKRVLKLQSTEAIGAAVERVSRRHGAVHARWQQRFVCLHGGETAVTSPGEQRAPNFDGSTGAAARGGTRTADGKVTVLVRNRTAACTDKSENVETIGKDCNADRPAARAVKYPARRGASARASYSEILGFAAAPSSGIKCVRGRTGTESDTSGDSRQRFRRFSFAARPLPLQRRRVASPSSPPGGAPHALSVMGAVVMTVGSAARRLQTHSGVAGIVAGALAGSFVSFFRPSRRFFGCGHD